MIRRPVFLATVILATVQAPAQDVKSLRVYFVGNSVTDGDLTMAKNFIDLAPGVAGVRVRSVASVGQE